jgi:ribosomal protein L40E
MNASDWIENAAICERCGERFGVGARFCRSCGAARPERPDEANAPTEAFATAEQRTDAAAESHESAPESVDRVEPAAADPATAERPRSPTPPAVPRNDNSVPPGRQPPPIPPGYQGSPQAGYAVTPEGYQVAPGSYPGYAGQPPGYQGSPQAGYPAVTPEGYQVAPGSYPGYAGQPPGYQGPPQMGYATPVVGYPVQQSPGTVAQQQEVKRPSRWLIGGIAAGVLGIVGIGVGVVLAASGGSSGQTGLVAAPVVTSAAATAAKPPSSGRRSFSTGRPSTPKASSSSQPSSVSPPSASVRSITPAPQATIAERVGQQQAVESTIHQEFALITEHKFSAAYALLAPSLQSGEAGWVASHRENGIYNVSVATNATINSDDSATASIVKMRTLDGEGCKNWTGSWNLIRIDGQWRISEANISPGSC